MTRSTGRFPSAYRAACPSAEKFNRAEYAPSCILPLVFDTQILRHSEEDPHEADFAVCSRRNGGWDEGVGAGAVHKLHQKGDPRPHQKNVAPRPEPAYSPESHRA